MIPIGDRIIIKQKAEEEKTNFGLILTDENKIKPNEGTVVAVGKKRLEDGSFIRLQVEVGDYVVYAGYAGTKVKVDDEEFIILDEQDVLAKN